MVSAKVNLGDPTPKHSVVPGWDLGTEKGHSGKMRKSDEVWNSVINASMLSQLYSKRNYF